MSIHSAILPFIRAVGYGEANVEALQFLLANDITEDVSLLKLFVSSTYVDMTGLKQDSLLRSARGRGFKMVRPPLVDLWDTWTYIIKTVETQTRRVLPTTRPKSWDKHSGPHLISLIFHQQNGTRLIQILWIPGAIVRLCL
jgi:hypothetical protein